VFQASSSISLNHNFFYVIPGNPAAIEYFFYSEALSGLFPVSEPVKPYQAVSSGLLTRKPEICFRPHPEDKQRRFPAVISREFVIFRINFPKI